PTAPRRARRSARDVRPAGATATPATVTSPASNVSSPFRQRSSVLLPPPDGPTTAIVSPAVTDWVIPVSTARPLNALESPRTRITRQPPLESPRQLGQWIAERHVEQRAQEARDQPAVQLGRHDRHALRQLDHGDRAHERRIFEERHEV